MQYFITKKVKLKLFPDLDMYISFEKGTRGGVFYITNIYSKANNKYLKSCDPRQESKHFTYLDAIIYMVMQCLYFFSIIGFKWIDLKQFDLNKYTSSSSKRCLLEVDFENPKELRELHNDYPLAPDKIEIKREILSEYQLKIAGL